MDGNYNKEELEFEKAYRDYHEAYRQLKKRKNVRAHERTGIRGGLIEIWEYEGERRKNRICKVEENDVTECYRRAAIFAGSYR